VTGVQSVLFRSESGMRALQRVLASKAPKTGASNTRTNVVRKATCFYFEVQINFNTSRFWEFFVFESLSLDVFQSILMFTLLLFISLLVCSQENISTATTCITMTPSDRQSNQSNNNPKGELVIYRKVH
jgi:hypothetical protein